MAVLKWSYKDDDKDEEDKIQNPISTIKSVQSSWQPSQDQNAQQNYFLTDEYKQQEAEKEAQRQAEEADRVAAENQARAAAAQQMAAQQQAQSQQEQASTASTPNNSDRAQKEAEYAQNIVNQNRTAWEKNRSWWDKLTGANAFNENQATANARSAAANAFTNWNNEADTARSQQLAQSGVNIANAQPKVDTTAFGSMANLATPVINATKPIANTIGNLGVDKSKLYNFVNEGLRSGKWTVEEAQDYLNREGLSNDLSRSQYILDTETGEYRPMTNSEKVNNFTRQINTPLRDFGAAAGSAGQQTADTLLGEDQDPTKFDWTNPSEYARFAINLMPGMVQGLSEDPEKIVLGFTQLADGDMQRGIANLTDAGIDVAGLLTGGSGTLLRAATGRAVAKRGAKEVIKELAKDMGQEAAEEFVQSLAGDVAESGEFGQVDLGKAAENAALGALGGGLMSGAGQGINMIKDRLNPTNLEAPNTGQLIPDENPVENSVQAGVGNMEGEGQRQPITAENITPLAPESTRGLNDYAEVNGVTALERKRNREAQTEAETSQILQEYRDQGIDTTEIDGSQAVTDIPAYQRQGRQLLSDTLDTARLDDLVKQSEYVPTSDSLRSNEFALRQKLAEDIKNHPELKQRLTKKFESDLSGLKESASTMDERLQELSDIKTQAYEKHQRQKIAQQLEAERIESEAKSRSEEPTSFSNLDNQVAKGETTVEEANLEKKKTAEKTSSVKGEDTDYMNELEGKTKTPKKDSVLLNAISKREVEPTDFKSAVAKIADQPAGTADVSFEEVIGNVKKGSETLKQNIINDYNTLKNLNARYNKRQNQIENDIKKGGAKNINTETSKIRNQEFAREISVIESRLNSRIKKLAGKNSAGEAVVNALNNIGQARKANMLLSLPSISRQIVQEAHANTLSFVSNPVKAIKSQRNFAKTLATEVKRSARGWTKTPSTISESLPYLLSNSLESAYTLTSAIAESRKDIVRYTLAETILKMNGDTNLTTEQIKAVGGALGNEGELVVNAVAGTFNGMSNRFQANDIIKNYLDFVKDGSASAHTKFLQSVNVQSTLAKSLLTYANKGDSVANKIVGWVINQVFPFITTVANLAKTEGYNMFNLKAMNVIDQIGKDVRSNPGNMAAILKNQSLKIGGVVAIMGLIDRGIITSNDDDEIDKPRGIYIDLGNGKFIPLRATQLELPISVIYSAYAMSKQAAEGKKVDVAKYFGYISDSLPYINDGVSISKTVNSAVKAITGESSSEDDYNIKSYATNMIKSLLPGSNNGFYAWSQGLKGESATAKSVYDKDFKQWVINTVKNSYNYDRDSLKDSRDASGLVRTVDSQGVIINKQINDAESKKYNEAIESNFKYLKDNNLFKDKNTVWDTWGDTKLKAVRTSIMFADDDQTKASFLKDNKDLYDLSKQIKNGVYGDGGADLLTLKGQNLYSDVSQPNKDGTINTAQPVSMIAINNAIAQTDMSDENKAKLDAITEANQRLYEQAIAKTIPWKEYYAKTSENRQQNREILASSENGRKLMSFYDQLNNSGFFEEGGYGSTKSGQVMLWNTLNAMLGTKGKTPTASWSTGGSGSSSSGYRTSSRSGSSKSFGSTFKPGNRDITGMKPSIKERSMATVKIKKYTPVKTTVKLNSQIKKDKSLNFEDRSF